MLSRDGEGAGEWQDWLEDDGINEASFAEHEEYSAANPDDGCNEGPERTRAAHPAGTPSSEPPLTLEDLATEFPSAQASARLRYGPLKSCKKPSATRTEMKLLPDADGDPALLPQ